MQKTSGFHRLLAVLVAVLLAVCCLPLSVLAEEQKVPVELEVSYQLDTRTLGSQTISLGELPYRQEAQVKGTYSWDTLYGKMNLPSDTRVKNRQTGERELAFSLKAEGSPWKANLTVEVESTIQHPSFRVQFEGVDNPQSVGTTIAIRPGSSVSAWDFLMKMTAYKTYAEQGYHMTGFTVSGDDHAPYTEADHYGLTGAISGKTITVKMEKEPESQKTDVAFTLSFHSTDGNIQDMKDVTVPYDPYGKSYDLWSYIESTGAYKGYKNDGYTMKNFVVPHQDGSKTYTGVGQFTVTPALRGATVTVELDKPVVSTKKTVDFTVKYLSNDKVYDVTKQVSAQYDPEGVLTDLWDYLDGTGTVQTAKKDGYTVQDYMLDGRTISNHGGQAVNGDLAGKTVTVHLYKEPVATAKTVNFQLRFLSTDNQIHETKDATLTYEPEGVLTDLWDFLLANEDYKTYAKDGYQLSDYVLSRETGDLNGVAPGIQAVTTELEGQTVIVHLVKKTETKVEQVPFTLSFRSTDGNIQDVKDVTVPYDPNGKSYDLWSYIESTGAYKSYQKDGYTMKNFVVPHQAGDKSYTGAGQFTVTPALRGATVTVELDKPVVSTKKTVDFTVKYLSNDKVFDVTKQVSAQYDPEGVLTDLWDYLDGTGTVQSAKKDGYTLEKYELDGRTVSNHGGQAVNGDLAGKTVTVHLYKAPVTTAKTVNFQLRFLSTDNQIHETKNATLTYEQEGVLTDLWDFLLANEDYKTFAKDGYKLSDYVLSRENGDLNGVAPGIQAVTTDLEGKTVIVHLVKESAARPENVDFNLRFLSNDGKIDVTKAVSVAYDPNGKSYDAWNYLLGTGSFQNYAKEGYALKDLVVPQPSGDVTYTGAGQFTVTPALKGKTVLVHLDNTKAPALYESVYTLHFVDEKGKEIQSTATVKVKWTEGQQLNLMAQLQAALKTVSAKGYTFQKLTAWNGNTPFKGTELVVPGNWELVAHCTKNAAPAQPQKPAAEATKAKPAANAAKAVVKPAAPAANNTKILPKTGLQLETPVVFGVMLFAALAGAAAYLFAVRKKLN